MSLKKDNNYTLLAPAYDLLGSILYFGALRRSQLHFLADIPKGSRILFIGGGTGFLLNPLFARCDPKDVWYVEKSGAMIRKSKKAVSHRYRQRTLFLHGTQEDIPKEETFDVVLSFFFFDQFQFMTLGKIFLELNTHLKPGGLWLWADFIPPQTWWQKILMHIMLKFFSLTTRLGAKQVYDVPAIFRKRGLKLEKEAWYYRGFIRTVLLRKS
ncbi:MAG: class I SAM-dependent methyltransferase [Bacteroidia bacterium]